MDLRRIATVGLVLALGGIVPGCGTSIRKQQNASEPYADGLKVGKKRKKPLRAIVHTAAYDASEGLVDGALDALEKPKRQAQFEKLAADLNRGVGTTTKTAGGGLVDGMKEKLPELRPVLSEMLAGVKSDLHLDPEGTAKRVMRGALAEAGGGMRDHVRPQVKGMTNDIVASVRKGFEGMIGPELRQRVHDHLVPAVQELTAGAPELAEKIGQRTAKGLTDGLAASLDPDAEGSLGFRLEHFSKEGSGKVDDWLGRTLLAALVIAFVALLIAVIRWLGERHAKLVAKRAQAAAEEQGRRNEEMLRLVASAIQKAGAEGSVEDFREQIKQLSQDDTWLRIRASLDEFLVRNRLKLERPRA